MSTADGKSHLVSISSPATPTASPNTNTNALRAFLADHEAEWLHYALVRDGARTPADLVLLTETDLEHMGLQGAIRRRRLLRDAATLIDAAATAANDSKDPWKTDVPETIVQCIVESVQSDERKADMIRFMQSAFESHQARKPPSKSPASALIPLPCAFTGCIKPSAVTCQDSTCKKVVCTSHARIVHGQFVCSH